MRGQVHLRGPCEAERYHFRLRRWRSERDLRTGNRQDCGELRGSRADPGAFLAFRRHLTPLLANAPVRRLWRVLPRARGSPPIAPAGSLVCAACHQALRARTRQSSLLRACAVVLDLGRTMLGHIDAAWTKQVENLESLLPHVATPRLPTTSGRRRSRQCLASPGNHEPIPVRTSA